MSEPVPPAAPVAPAAPATGFFARLASFFSGLAGFLNTVLPQRAKFFAADVALLVTYLEAYGPVWKLVPAVIAIATSLGVYGIPNASKPANL